MRCWFIFTLCFRVVAVAYTCDIRLLTNGIALWIERRIYRIAADAMTHRTPLYQHRQGVSRVCVCASRCTLCRILFPSRRNSVAVLCVRRAEWKVPLSAISVTDAHGAHELVTNIHGLTQRNVIERTWKCEELNEYQPFAFSMEAGARRSA